VPGRASSYAVQADARVRLIRLNYENYGATGVQSTARDLTRWAQGLLHPRVIDPSVIADLKQPGRLRDGSTVRYGLGLSLVEAAGRPSLGHNGSDAGYRANFAVFPDDDLSIVVLSNGTADVGRLSDALADIFLPRTASARALEAAAAPADAETLAGLYFDGRTPIMDLRWASGRLERAAPGPVTPVTFLADGRFYVGRPGQIFRRAPNGRDLLADVAVKSRAATWRRITRASPSASELEELTGLYRSEELDVTYRLSVVDGGLQLSSLKLDPILLAPAEADVFESAQLYGTIVKIGRDRAGRADRLLVNPMGGRLRDVVMWRLPGSPE